MRSDAEVRVELRPLTSLRFAAAMLVFVLHCPATSAFAKQYDLGQAGVGFFFVLSGFILMYSYHRVFAAAPVWTEVRNFYAARFARVYPAYALASLAALGVLAFVGDGPWNASTPVVRSLALAAQLLVLQAWVPVYNICFGINATAWSVSTEAYFYVVFPALAYILLRAFREAAGWRIAAAAVLLWIVPTALFSVPNSLAGWGTYMFPPVRLVDFTVGMVCALAYLRHAAGGRGAVRWTLLEFGAIAAVGASIAFSSHVPAAVRDSLALVPAWAALIVVSAYGRGAIGRVLSSALAVRLGEVSYALYLLHWTIIIALGPLPRLPGPAAFALTLGIALAAGFALHYGVERPLRGRLRRALSCKPSAAAKLNSASTIAVPAIAYDEANAQDPKARIHWKLVNLD